MATFEQFRSTFPEDSNEKGEAFEVFLAEWLFKNHPVLSSEYKKIWRFSDWPKAWSSTDIGTDLIAENQQGKICAIQAKFYKETSTIPKRDIDSFLSDTNRAEVDFRLLVATTDGLGKNASNAIEGQEKPVHSFTLQHFLEPFDWPESLESLQEYQPREPHQPRPHQVAAIDDVTNKIESRGQLLMACGTGKTLTGQRIAEKLAAKSTLVLLPSLLLLSKTVKDWVSEREQDFIFLPVCSDRSVTKQTDEIAVNESELCFRSTTDAKEIAEFLKRPENKVIFSTYQSSPQIAEAFEQENLAPFDLILADEAHRCAGKISSEYSTVLSEKLIPAHKRLFMTATPRMYAARIRKKAKDAEIEIASMDDESVFGPVLHHLTFGQAIANDPPLLTDYRVLVVGVNNEVAKQMVEERAFVKTEGGLADDAQSIATQLGLSKAVRDYDLKRVISFHSRVNLARDFASSFLEFQSDLKSEHKPEGKISYSHVSGEMTTSQRSKELRALGALENEDRYLLGNARCLSEGVDVPALDGVAFVDPRRSEIDIIQAVGRAIRLSEGKETGTIVIPVFLSDEDDPDEVLSSSQFDQVWKVVNALRSHDESLGEMLDQFRVGLGRKQKVSFKNTKIVLDVPTMVSEDFVEAFETKLVETTTASWEAWFGLLLEYKAEFGDCMAQQGQTFQGVKLGSWVRNQRAAKETLPTERRQRLDDLGFVWDPYTAQWEENFKALSAYKAEFGNLEVKHGLTYKALQLGIWISNQRSNKKTLSTEKVQRLDDLGFVWDPSSEQWEENFRALSAYKAEFGDCLAPRDLTYRGLKLGSWASTQRRTKEILSAERIKRLEDLGFVWDPITKQWEENFKALAAYKEEFGDCMVPAGSTYHDLALGNWVARQRAAKETLSTDRIKRLDDLGFVWDPLTKRWEENFKALAAYKEEFGDCMVPGGSTYHDLALGNWAAKQRAAKETLSTDRIKRLEDLGFVWDPHTKQWEENFKALVAYKSEFGDSFVPRNFTYQGKKLGQWISSQRTIKEKLSKERIQRLDDLGFVWDPSSEQWEENFRALSAYKAEFGDCLIPQRLIYQGLKLGSWVGWLRKSKEKLSPERIKRLDDLGFAWKAR